MLPSLLFFSCLVLITYTWLFTSKFRIDDPLLTCVIHIRPLMSIFTDIILFITHDNYINKDATYGFCMWLDKDLSYLRRFTPRLVLLPLQQSCPQTHRSSMFWSIYLSMITDRNQKFTAADGYLCHWGSLRESQWKAFNSLYRVILKSGLQHGFLTYSKETAMPLGSVRFLWMKLWVRESSSLWRNYILIIWLHMHGGSWDKVVWHCKYCPSPLDGSSNILIFHKLHGMKPNQLSHIDQGSFKLLTR